MTRSIHNVSAILQVGGRGQRLRPLTDNTPKCLLSVGNDTILERLLDQLSHTGICSATIITGWLGEQIEAYVNSIAKTHTNLELRIVHEDKPLGNIGCLSKIPETDDDLLFLFGDLVTNIDFSALLADHKNSGADVTLASHLDPYQINFGELKVEGTRVTNYIEKPVKHTLICSGVAVLSPRIITLIPPDQPMGISDLISRAIQKKLHVAHWRHESLWIDVNSKSALIAARHAVTSDDGPDVSTSD